MTMAKTKTPTTISHFLPPLFLGASSLAKPEIKSSISFLAEETSSSLGAKGLGWASGLAFKASKSDFMVRMEISGAALAFGGSGGMGRGAGSTLKVTGAAAGWGGVKAGSAGRGKPGLLAGGVGAGAEKAAGLGGSATGIGRLAGAGGVGGGM